MNQKTLPQTAAYSLQQIRVDLAERTVLSLPSLTIEAGKVTAITGPNGSGKTTLLRVLALLLTPSAGTTQLFGTAVRYKDRSLRKLRQQVTMVAQSPLLFHRSVRANVTYGLRVRGVLDSRRVAAALEAVGMQQFAEAPARELSGGEVQRVAIARALALDPDVLLLDEPTANLDREHVPLVEELITTRAAAGKTVVFTTHRTEQAFRLGEEHVALLDGRPVATPLTNLLRGTIEHKTDGSYFATAGVRIEIPAGANPQFISIDPDDLLLSPRPLESSARNCLPGTIRRVEHAERGILLTIDCGLILTARITTHSYRDLGLNLGTSVFVTFKSSSIHLHGDALKIAPS